tara:strand:+ start:364 stop:564 length:201 start_codon:yes stop_codon:yes gene_type:complete
MNFMNQIKRVLRRLSPQEMAAVELADMELYRLEAHTALENASNALNTCNDRIKRLRKFLAESEKLT